MTLIVCVPGLSEYDMSILELRQKDVLQIDLEKVYKAA